MPTEPETTTPPQPSALTVCSVSTYGNVELTIFRRTVGETSAFLVHARSNSAPVPTMIPLADVPALILLLEEVARAGISVRTAAPSEKPRPSARAKKK